MGSQVTNYQCPACTAPLTYSGESGMLECAYCGSAFDPEQIEKLYQEKEAAAEEAFLKEGQKEADEWEEAALSQDWGEEAEQMRAYTCPSCGAELICEETTAATSCPYCGNSTVVPGQFHGVLKPDYILPFRLDKAAAVAALKGRYRGKFFLPKTFSEENQIQKLQGIYVPFWLYDGQAVGDASFAATSTTVHRQGDYRVYTTRHYRVSRSGRVRFEKIPADASKKMPDDYMDAIEPFDYQELKDFSTAYLPGYLADRYDVSAEECAGRAKQRAEQTLLQALERDVTGYDTRTLTGRRIHVEQGKIHYALLPVWLLNTKWRGKDFLFAMNGQTGRLVGDLPIDWKKAALTFLGILGVCWPVLYAVMYFAGLGG